MRLSYKERMVRSILYPPEARPYISSVSMRGRVRNNCFSLRVGVAQKATFARDAARCVARAYAFRLKLKKKARARPTRFGNRERQWFPVPSLRGVQLSGLRSRE